MKEERYLTTEEAGEYLRLKPRKVYELAAAGEIPCSKVTGKWLFPRAALDRWVETGLARPEGFSPAPPPAVIGGSTDPLLEWAVRQSGAGLASLPEGSEAGLRRLANDEIAIGAIHMHRLADDGDPEDPDAAANLQAVTGTAGLHDAVVIAFARREQGLLVAPGNPLGLETVGDAAESGARAVLRQSGAGAQQLLQRLLDEIGLDENALTVIAGEAATGQDLASAIRAGTADWGVATRAVANTHGLGFVPLAWERFDLAMRRRTYFEPGPQALMQFLAQPEFAERAAALGGYDVSVAGEVRLNA
ncbi:MAG: helix-turn-helix transcriptional regulator [Alphaproteobacteria bacterium]